MRPSFVYVFALDMKDESYFKFGVSANPSARKAYLEVHCPKKLRTMAISPKMTRADAFRLEWLSHRALSKFHSHGEWYRGCPKVLSAAEIIRSRTFRVACETFIAWAEEGLKFAVSWESALNSRPMNRLPMRLPN